jgi:glycosyltransferase involved in cell wall biosynthesis
VSVNILIYNINSFGGNHSYAVQLFQAYRQHPAVDKVQLIMPANSTLAKDYRVHNVLLADKISSGNPLLKKLYFIYRSFVNPVRLYRLLKKEPSSVVVFNDYDQLSSFYWVPLFKRLKRQHIFSVILHDPDRDQYLPSKRMAIGSMNKVMSLMDAAFYHGYLPDKPYYKGNFLKAVVPHGIYPPVEGNETFRVFIASKRNKRTLLGILGNIRDEKNYEVVLEALALLPDCQLLVAGAKANAEVPVERYRKKITELGLEDRVIWVERYLDETELQTAINVCDIVLLYYKPSFTSQSGMLNTIAPYKKKLVVTDTPSALQQVTARYKLGVLAPPDDKTALIQAIQLLQAKKTDEYESGWRQYEQEASWTAHVQIAIETFKKAQAI